MSQLLQRIKFKSSMLQTCPLCGVNHPILVQGLVSNPEDVNQKMPVLDRGYSFCNCSNIFYTDWSNMDPSIYDEEYNDRYNNDNITDSINKYADVYYPVLKGFNPDIQKFAEIGSINHVLLDRASEEGWETLGIDINPNVTSENHKIDICDVEKYTLKEKQDVIWASHIFEHFKDPLKVAENLYNSLNDDGILFISMPDPYFINWTEPHNWVHWHLREHHIMWDMDSFIEKLEDIGFECVQAIRNDGAGFICYGDYHLMFKKDTPGEVMPDAQA